MARLDQDFWKSLLEISVKYFIFIWSTIVERCCFLKYWKNVKFINSRNMRITCNSHSSFANGQKKFYGIKSNLQFNIVQKWVRCSKSLFICKVTNVERLSYLILFWYFNSSNCRGKEMWFNLMRDLDSEQNWSRIHVCVTLFYF